MTDTTHPYTPSVAEMREYVETGGEPRPWVELDESEKAREKFRADAFDRMLAQHDAEVKLAAHEAMADLLASSLRMIQGGAIGQHNVLSEEKAEGFQLAIDNITNFVRSIREERGND